MERIYFIGIAGSLMGNVASLLKQAGHAVGGSDLAAYPPVSDLLIRHGIEVDEGFRAQDLIQFAPTVVVVGNAVSRGNPQVEVAWAGGAWRVLSLPETIDTIVFPDRPRIVIAGTHGKTTTASLTAWILRAGGGDPGFLIGGVVPDLGGGAALGAEKAGSPVVLEGDEYDCAFFDKRSKFIHYRPSILVLNNLEFDHADIFRDIEDVRRAFRHLLASVRPEATVLFNADDSNLSELLPVPWCRPVSVGFGEGADWRLENRGSRLVLHPRQGDAVTIEIGGRGETWQRNAAMAVLAARRAVPSVANEIDLTGFAGVKRRMEVLGQSASVVVMEDFGHHPTAICATLKAIRVEYPNHRIWAAFEPRSNTARRKVFEREFAEALGLADRAWIGSVHRASQVPARDRFDPSAVCTRLRELGIPAETCGTNTGLGQAIRVRIEAEATEARPILMVFFTNGSFDGIQHALAAQIGSAA